MQFCKGCGHETDELSSQGLCSYCIERINDILSSIKSLNLKVADSTEMIGGRILNCDFIIEYIEELLKFESKGIDVCDPKAQIIMDKFKEIKKELQLEQIRDLVHKLIEKASLASTIKTKVNSANKALLKISDAKKRFDFGANLFQTLEIDVKRFVHEAKLSDFLEKARKAAFMGKRKKALEQYQEALYYLKTDEIDDSFQKENIKLIEEEIRQLGDNK